MLGIDATAPLISPVAQAPQPAVAKDSSSFSFGDFLDIVNPLQHIPVVSTIYRHLTGDEIKTPEKLAGDTLYGGLTGLLCSLGDTLFQELTGKSVGDTVYAMVVGDDDKTTAVASDTTTPASVTPASSLTLPELPALPDIALPGLSFLNETRADEPTVNPVAAQRAVAAYRAAGRTIEAY